MHANAANASTQQCRDTTSGDLGAIFFLWQPIETAAEGVDRWPPYAGDRDDRPGLRVLSSPARSAPSRGQRNVTCSSLTGLACTTKIARPRPGDAVTLTKCGVSASLQRVRHLCSFRAEISERH